MKLSFPGSSALPGALVLETEAGKFRVAWETGRVVPRAPLLSKADGTSSSCIPYIKCHDHTQEEKRRRPENMLSRA